jgi:hypothetical protein
MCGAEKSRIGAPCSPILLLSVGRQTTNINLYRRSSSIFWVVNQSRPLLTSILLELNIAKTLLQKASSSCISCVLGHDTMPVLVVSRADLLIPDTRSRGHQMPKILLFSSVVPFLMPLQTGHIVSPWQKCGHTRCETVFLWLGESAGIGQS